MSEIRLNLVDSQTILVGTIHGSIGDSCIAALSAEPETISELNEALRRFEHNALDFHSLWTFSNSPAVDLEPYDAGILVIDLAARVVAADSTYSVPSPVGQVHYHDGESRTDVPLLYQVPDDWLFVKSIDFYKAARQERFAQRMANPPFDARPVLYGHPLVEFLATNFRLGNDCKNPPTSVENDGDLSPKGAIHAQWLLTPRADLHGRSPRDVMLEKRFFLDRDLEFRALQWSMLLEGPPCLDRQSYAYRYAGFGTNEWVIYYELIRHLLANADLQACDDFSSLVQQLETLKQAWLNEPNQDFEGRVPAIIIENERKRLPEAMGGRSMVVDEDCPLCKMMGDECESGREVCFWHLDCSAMEEHFAFSTFQTEEQYLANRAELESFHLDFDRRWREREERIARGEEVEPDEFFDAPLLEEFSPFNLSETEPPEA
jgi:hypothetical protein